MFTLCVWAVMISVLAVAVFLLWEPIQPPWTTAFKVFSSPGSLTHRQITEMAILRKTAQVCRDISIAEGQDFILPVRTKDQTIEASILLQYLLVIQNSHLCNIFHSK